MIIIVKGASLFIFSVVQFLPCLLSFFYLDVLSFIQLGFGMEVGLVGPERRKADRQRDGVGEAHLTYQHD